MGFLGKCVATLLLFVFLALFMGWIDSDHAIKMPDEKTSDGTILHVGEVIHTGGFIGNLGFAVGVGVIAIPCIMIVLFALAPLLGVLAAIWGAGRKDG